MSRVFLGRNRSRFIIVEARMANADEAEITSELKQKLIASGISQREAAKRFGVSHIHLNYVLNGHRQSARLTRRILALPQKTVAAK